MIGLLDLLAYIVLAGVVGWALMSAIALTLFKNTTRGGTHDRR